MKPLLLFLAAVLTVACAAAPGSSLYDRHIGAYRTFYDRVLSTRNAANSDFFDAVHGDAAAAHRLFHQPDRDVYTGSERAWDRDCWVLLLKLGDGRFYDLLVREDQPTQRLVGLAITSFSDTSDCPRTMELVRPSLR